MMEAPARAAGLREFLAQIQPATAGARVVRKRNRYQAET